METKSLKENNAYSKMPFEYKLLIIIASLSATCAIASDLLTYKLFEVGGIIGSASLITFPPIYLLSDVITEIYGKKTARFLLYVTLFSEFALDVGLSYIIQLPSPASFHDQIAYDKVIGTLSEIYFGALIAIFISSLINIMLMARFNQKANGRWYALRSFCSTMIGLTCFAFIAYFIWFWGIKSVSQILELIAVSLASKVVIVLIMIVPSALIVKWLKSKIKESLNEV